MQTAPATSAPSAKAPSGRDAFIADMAAMRGADDAPAAKPAPAKEPPAASEDDTPVDPLALADGGDPDADDAAATAAAVIAAAKDREEPPKEEVLDPAATRKIEAAQREERRRKDALKAERDAARAEAAAELAKIEEARGSVAAATKAVKDHEALMAKVRADPLAAIELLRGAGYDESAFAALSHAAWAETPKGRENPQVRAQAERLAREREVGGGIAELRKQIEDLKAGMEAEKKNAATERAVNGYLDAALEVAATGKVTEVDEEGNEIVAATVEAPIFKRWMKSDRTAAREQVMKVADEMAGKAQREHEPMPTPAEVLAEVERRERIALKKRGIDPAALFAATPAAAEPPKKPTPPPPGKTLARAGAAPAPTKKKLTEEELRADFVRQRASGKFDDE